jgi:hypothetical protein
MRQLRKVVKKNQAAALALTLEQVHAELLEHADLDPTDDDATQYYHTLLRRMGENVRTVVAAPQERVQAEGGGVQLLLEGDAVVGVLYIPGYVF